MSDHLANLPPEIRIIIYEYALLRPEVYPYEYGNFKKQKVYTLRGPILTSSLAGYGREIPAIVRLENTPEPATEEADMAKSMNLRPNPPPPYS